MPRTARSNRRTQLLILITKYCSSLKSNLGSLKKRLLCWEWTRWTWVILCSVLLAKYKNQQSGAWVFTQEKWKLCSKQDFLICKFHRALFSLAPNWKPPESTGEQINCGVFDRAVVLRSNKESTMGAPSNGNKSQKPYTKWKDNRHWRTHTVFLHLCETWERQNWSMLMKADNAEWTWAQEKFVGARNCLCDGGKGHIGTHLCQSYWTPQVQWVHFIFCK